MENTEDPVIENTEHIASANTDTMSFKEQEWKGEHETEDVAILELSYMSWSIRRAVSC